MCCESWSYTPTQTPALQTHKDVFREIIHLLKTLNQWILTMAGFIAGPVYLDPATTKQMVARESKSVLASNLRGPLRIISKTAKVIPKLKMVSAIAPVCTSTRREGPEIICLYFSGMNSMMANAPPAAPAAW